MFQLHKTVDITIKACVIFCMSLSLSSCSLFEPNRTTSETNALLYSQDTAFEDLSEDSVEKLISKLEVKSRLLTQYSAWKGVRYKFGGTSKKGIDCSAFVQITFREQFGLNLPRTTGELYSAGKSVASTQLKSGDLILFKIDSRTRHVGIYLGNDQFVHASASKGVMISNLKNRYWTKRYSASRRVLSQTNLSRLI